MYTTLTALSCSVAHVQAIAHHCSQRHSHGDHGGTVLIIRLCTKAARLCVQNSSFTNVSTVNMFWAGEDGLVITDDLTGDAGLKLDKVFNSETRASEKTAPASALTSLDSDRISPPRAADPWLASLQEVRRLTLRH